MYFEFLKSFAEKHNLNFIKIDDKVCKLNDKNNWISMFFRQYDDYLEGWGADIDFKDEISLADLEKLLEENIKQKFIAFLDENYFDFTYDILTKPLHKYIKKGAKYLFVLSFTEAPEFYKVEKKKLVAIEIPKPINALEILYEDFKNVYNSRIILDYLGWIESRNRLFIKTNDNKISIRTNIFGNFIRISKENTDDEIEETILPFNQDTKLNF